MILTATTSPRSTHVTRTGVRLLAAILALSLALTGCTTDPFTGEEKVSNTGKGAGIGAAAGAVAGAVFGGPRRAVLIGAGIGALLGGGVGLYMDKQEDKLREQLSASGVSVTRSGNNIILNMPGNVTFATDSSDINANFYQVLDSVVLVLNEFEKTYIDITGHTDNTGAAEYNLRLSEARANSVARYLEHHKVIPQRIITRGDGIENPVATNDTPEGRALNRRVELMLTPLT